jgi:DNA-directed RNA polymerase I subunit RPA2
MEDAMIINKAAYERGFGHGSVYKTLIIDLEEEEKRISPSGAKPSLIFCNIKIPPHGTKAGNDMAGEKYYEDLDVDGLPEEGTELTLGKPLCCFVDEITGEHRTVKHKDDEKAFVDTVRVLGTNRFFIFMLLRSDQEYYIKHSFYVVVK